jgi:hypothetical protein
MTDEFPTLLEANDDTLFLGVFVIGLVHPPKRENEQVLPEDIQEQYVGDTTKACALIALGLIQNNAAHGEQSILLHHHDTTIIFPKQYE